MPADPDQARKLIMELKEALKTLKPAIELCWSQIAYDVLAAAETVGDTVNNEEAVEACLDADRLLLVTENAEAHQLARDLYREWGYHKVLTYLSDNISLC